jgi:hypothetical protein
VSTKIYAGYRSHEHAIGASLTWLRIAIWQNVAQAAAGCATFEDVKAFVEDHAEAGIHMWHDPLQRIALYSLFGLPGFVEKLPRPPRFLREYNYWNNTDPPDGMTRRRWLERGRTWNRVALDGRGWEARLTNIVLPKGTVGAYALAEECLPRFREHWKIDESSLLSKQPLPKRV